MGPGHIYYLAIGLTALLVAPFSPLARVIVTCWFAGEMAYMLGMPLAWVNLVQHLAALVIGSRYLRTEWCLMAWVLFAPILLCDALALTEGQAVMAWWALLATALLQLALLPLGMNMAQLKATIRHGIEGYRENHARKFLRLYPATSPARATAPK